MAPRGGGLARDQGAVGAGGPRGAPARSEVTWRERLRRVTRSRWWPVVRFVVGLGLAALALSALKGQRAELVGASEELTHLELVWLLVAIVLEIASFVSFGLLERRLLSVGGVRAGVGFMTTLSAAQAAIANSLPGGPAFSSIYVYRAYRRRGADETLAVWTLLATFVCSAATLSFVATAGVVLAFSESAAYDLVGVILGLFAVSLVADAVVFQRRWLADLMVGAFGVSRRLVGRPRREGAVVVAAWASRLEGLRLTWRDLAVSLAGALGNWVLDCGCLVCAFLAVGGTVPWRGLLLAYGAGQLAANLPITPGGLVVVEGSLQIALTAFGGSALTTVSAVLLYRIISFWGFLPVGWSAWAGLGLAHRWRRDRAAAVPAGSAVGLPSQEERATVGELSGATGEGGHE